VCVCARVRARPSPRASNQVAEPGLLAGTSTPRYETGWILHTQTHTHTHTHITGWILQLLKSLSTFTQTAKWWQRLVMLTSLECLVGIMKLFERGKRVTASHHAARNSRPGRILHRAITHCVLGPGRPAASTGQCRLQLGIAARCA
jgi:hypothetical protein